MNCRGDHAADDNKCPFGATALTSSGIPTRLLRCALDEPTAVLSMALVGVVSEYVWYN